MKDVRRFSIKRTLAPRYIGPYLIIEKYGPLSYQLELLLKLLGVHNVLHVSQLKRCLKPLTDVVIEDTIPSQAGFDIHQCSDRDSYGDQHQACISPSFYNGLSLTEQATSEPCNVSLPLVYNVGHLWAMHYKPCPRLYRRTLPPV
jgi:hypothetical protein